MNHGTGPTLLLHPPRTTTAELLGQAAAWRGHTVVGSVEQATGTRVYWYGGPLAADRAAARLGLGLLEPADDWLTTVPYDLTRRRIRLTTLDEARALTGPAFVKPPSAKIEDLPAALHADGSRLPRHLDADTAVLISDPVEFAAEYRLFALDGEVAAGSRYATHGRLDPGPLDTGAHVFARELLGATAKTLPSAVCVDIGRLTDGHWAVVEANMAWFAHSYTAEPDRVLDVLLRAAGPLTHVRDPDLPYVRATCRP
ncbi:ATP-grasp domain-containing protein [Streptomyces purpureus]|uniref:ATP-grasp domain-containing protein n=1 Tax=Streptomyces purpureus TaxID=1951 RepID=UPI00379B369F